MHLKSIGIITAISLVGALLFQALNFPVPWMLGPMFAVLIGQFFIKIPLMWPVPFRNIGLIIVGISIGQIFQLKVFTQMGWLLLLMLILNFLLVVCGLIMALGIKKWGNISLKTALTCTVAGGLSQIVIFAEEEKDIDLAVVTYFHVVRVISIVLLIPFILSGHAIQGTVSNEMTIKSLLIIFGLLIISLVLARFGKKVKIPVPYFLTPVIFIIILNCFGVETPHIPNVLLHIAQLLMGAYIGMLLKPNMIKLGKKVLLLGVGSALLLLAFTFAQGLLLVNLLDYSIPTSFLSMAAGGLDQMSLIAKAVGADVSVVTVFQIFRILFVFLVVLPLLKMACANIDKRDMSVVED